MPSDTRLSRYVIATYFRVYTYSWVSIQFCSPKRIITFLHLVEIDWLCIFFVSKMPPMNEPSLHINLARAARLMTSLFEMEILLIFMSSQKKEGRAKRLLRKKIDPRWKMCCKKNFTLVEFFGKRYHRVSSERAGDSDDWLVFEREFLRAFWQSFFFAKWNIVVGPLTVTGLLSTLISIHVW